LKREAIEATRKQPPTVEVLHPLPQMGPRVEGSDSKPKVGKVGQGAARL
jgi:hypothetical protein